MIVLLTALLAIFGCKENASGLALGTLERDRIAHTATANEVRWISSEPAFTPFYALNQEERARLMYLAEAQRPKIRSVKPNAAYKIG